MSVGVGRPRAAPSGAGATIRAMITIDQALLIELDRRPRSTPEELQHALRGQAAIATIARWLRAHEGWLVVREAAGWRLSPTGEGFLTALD